MSSVKQDNTDRVYWRSLDELANTPAFQEAASKEFAHYDPQQVLKAPSRRGFMKLMGASMAMAGLGTAGCRRWPEKQLAPYTHRPEGSTPGERRYYASIMDLGGYAQPILAASFDGRPIKIEGNPSHPMSAGAANAQVQADVLGLYDPQRSRHVKHAGDSTEKAVSSWADFDQATQGLAKAKGEGLAILTGNLESPSLDRVIGQLPKAKRYRYEPLSRANEVAGAVKAFGRPLRTHLHLDRARVIVCLDADPLGTHPAETRYARDWAAGRRTEDSHHKPTESISRMYVVEPAFTVTGTNADRRLPLESTKIAAFVGALAAQLGVSLQGAGASQLDEKARAFAADVAEDLKAHAGHGVVAVGPDQPADVHAAAHAINAKLGNLGKTVTLTAESHAHDDAGQMRQLVKDMGSGAVSTLLILGGNPVYNAPADVDFEAALQAFHASTGAKRTSVHLGLYEDETAAACTWHLPASHYLEAWGDGRSYDGRLSIQQPLIRPLYNTRSAIELLAKLAGMQSTRGRDIVRGTFKAAGLIAEARFEKDWRRTLHDGVLADSAAQAQNVTAVKTEQIRLPMPVEGLELVFRGDACVHDGRFANNAWLQEMPDPVTKLVWDNALLVNPNTAKQHKLRQDDLVTVTSGDRSMNAAVHLAPGQARGTVSIALGYGRTAAGSVGNHVGFNAYPLRTGSVVTDVALAPAQRRYRLVATQEHHLIDTIGMAGREGRIFGEQVRRDSMDAYKEHPNFAQHSHLGERLTHVENGKRVPLQLFDPPIDFDEQAHQWGMSIDLNACTGCGACIVACQAENNIGVVGKDECHMGREMHWIRVDRFFAGDVDDPEVVHQPVTCHHCENAPCEQVCPVAATTHDTEGLNVMIYNRCIGTRYCSNNCPYKVRRFNFFDWHAKPPKGAPWTGTYIKGFPDQQQLDPELVHPIRRLQFNPDVTVRMRGVMEKCTFCVQRIKAATIPAKNEGRRVADGEITPACAQTCATQAITFGNLADRDSRVRADFRQNPRSYELLEELNVRARVRYMARIVNPGHGKRPHGAADDHGHGGGHGGHHDEKHGHDKDHGPEAKH